jgi:hypothetical protein
MRGSPVTEATSFLKLVIALFLAARRLRDDAESPLVAGAKLD